MYIGSWWFSRVANKSIWSLGFFLRIFLKTRSGRDHSVDRATFLLNWSAMTLNRPWMWCTSSVQFINAARRQINSAIIDRWNTVEVPRLIAAIAAELSQRIWITWSLLSTINKANHIVSSSNVFMEKHMVRSKVPWKGTELIWKPQPLSEASVWIVRLGDGLPSSCGTRGVWSHLTRLSFMPLERIIGASNFTLLNALSSTFVLDNIKRKIWLVWPTQLARPWSCISFRFVQYFDWITDFKRWRSSSMVDSLVHTVCFRRFMWTPSQSNICAGSLRDLFSFIIQPKDSNIDSALVHVSQAYISCWRNN